MADPYLAEIRLMSFDFPPRGWALCEGQTLPINQNQALYNLLGTEFGGDGTTTFALPDMRGRTPIHVGNRHTLGESDGEQTHTLSGVELPSHFHQVAAQTSANAGQATPFENFLGGANNAYAAPNGSLQTLREDTVSSTGGAQAHPNMQPYIALNFCIALQGIYPSPN
jgi:microcystin-dependent protein